MKTTIGNVNKYPTLLLLFTASKKVRDQLKKEYDTGHLKEAFEGIDKENASFWNAFTAELIKLNLVPAGAHSTFNDNVDINADTGDIVWNHGAENTEDSDDESDVLDAMMAAFEDGPEEGGLDDIAVA